MNFLKDIIQRCHRRQKNSLQQQKTVATPSILRRSYTHQYRVYCARNYAVLLDDLEHAEISFMPIGHAPKHDSGAQGLAVGSRRFTRRFGIEDWKPQRWDASYGIMIYTGIPSERHRAQWHDIEFKYEAICAAPDAVLACVEVLANSVANPLLTLTKSGGLRFSCRVQDYLHSDTEKERLYIYKHVPTADNPYHRAVYLEIFGDKGYSRWDARYEILLGNLLDTPLISKEGLFAPVDALRDALHEPAPEAIIQASNTPHSLGTPNLDLAKEAFLKRGFTYLRQETGFHHWARYGGDVNNTDVILWEHDDTVFIRTATPNAGLPIEATPITEVWSDIDILPPTLTRPLPVSEQVLAVRTGKISPLAIKRPAPVLHKSKSERKKYVSTEEILDGTARVIGLITETYRDNNAIESYLINNSATCLNNMQAHDLFQKCSVSKNALDEWTVNWRGEPLGNFASALIHALQNRGESHAFVVKRIRTVKQAFESQEKKIIQQMSESNVQGKDNDNMKMSTAEAIRLDTEPDWTFWDQLKRFFAHYTRDTDAPIQWDNTVLTFYIPPVLHPSIKRLVLISPTHSEQHLRRTFPDDKVEVKHIQLESWQSGNQVFQIRTGLYPSEEILDYGNAWDVISVSKTGECLFAGIRAEIQRDPSVKHTIVSSWIILQKLQKLIKKANVSFMTEKGKTIGENTDTDADVFWIVGAPERSIGNLLEQSQKLFGNDAQPLNYDRETNSYRYKDERVQSVNQTNIINSLTRLVGQIGLSHQTGKKVVLLTGLEIHSITDRPETTLFDWEDFEIAGGLDKLPEVIETRQRFEAERDNLTADSSRKEVESVLGCSPRQANRFLQKLRGGNHQRVTFREQILALLTDGEKRTAELVESIEGHPEAIKHELTRLVNAKDIIRIRHGVYRSQ